MLALLHLVQEHPLNQSDVSTSWSDVSDDSDHYPKDVIRSELLTCLWTGHPKTDKTGSLGHVGRPRLMWHTNRDDVAPSLCQP